MAALPPHLAFTLLEADPAAPGFTVDAQADGYAGATEVWLMRGDALAFADALDALDSSLRGEARLRAGWGDVPDLELVIRPHGRAGALEADVRLFASARWPHRHAVHVRLVLPEPGALTRFREAFRAMLAPDGPSCAVLTSARHEAGV
jgi:hypothetical protein